MRTLSAPLAPNEARRRKTPEALARLHSRARYSLALLTAEGGGSFAAPLGHALSSETIYYAWLGCASLLGKCPKSAHKMALCAAIPKPSLSYRRLKKQRVPANLIGARYWLAERYGL